MPGFPTPDSGGNPPPDSAGPRSGFLPSGKPGGQITISRREALALIAFDSEDDEGKAISRARRETSFDDDQLKRLKNRAEKVRAKGYTLTNGAHKFMPTNYDGDSDSLLGQEEQRGDAKNRPARDGKRTSAAAKTTATKGKAKETQVHPSWRILPAGPTRRTQEAWSAVHECDGDAMCGPCRAAHDAAAPAREAFAKRVREKKRKMSCMHERGVTLEDMRVTLLREAAASLSEKWSDAARAAAAANRRKGGLQHMPMLSPAQRRQMRKHDANLKRTEQSVLNRPLTGPYKKKSKIDKSRPVSKGNPFARLAR